MKGGLAAALWAAKSALEQGFRPRGDVLFHVVSDEEVVGNGTREIVERAPAADVTVSLEPTELRLCAAEGGLVHFRIEVEGVEAHASTRYLSVHAGGNGGGGVNAVEKVIKIIVALQELEREWAITKSHPILPPGYDTLSPGIIVGGPGGGSDGRLNLFSNAGTTPNYCSVEYNLWFYPDESFEDVQAEVEGRRRRLRRRPVAARASAAVHVEARPHLLPAARPAARPPRRPDARRLPRASRARPGAAGLRRRDRPRVVRRARAARCHLRARPARAVPRRRRVPRDRAAALAAKVYGLCSSTGVGERGAERPVAGLLDLSGRVALVTGAAQGFGFACARRLSEAGASVLLTDRRGSRSRRPRRGSKEGRDVAAAVATWLSQTRSTRSSAVVDRFGRLDILVNNAAAYSNVVSRTCPSRSSAGCST